MQKREGGGILTCASACCLSLLLWMGHWWGLLLKEGVLVAAAWDSVCGPRYQPAHGQCVSLVEKNIFISCESDAEKR